MASKSRYEIVIDTQFKGRGVKEAKTSFKELGVEVAKGGAVLVAAGLAAKKAYEFIGEGAELSFAAEQFDNLAASIGSTGEVLRKDLTSATKGMVSQSDLMADAGTLMSQKLAVTHDKVVELASVSGQLNWDMGVLGLTINNLSDKRLDTLGLAVSDVVPRFKELKAAGMDAQQAFTTALIEAGTKKIEISGNIAESTAGQMMMLEAATSDMSDTFSVFVATSAPVGNFMGVWPKLMGGATGIMREMSAAQEDVNRAVELGIIPQEMSNWLVEKAALGIGDYRDILEKVRDVLPEETAAIVVATASIEDNTIAIEDNEALYESLMSTIATATGIFEDTWVDTAKITEEKTAEMETAVGESNAAILEMERALSRDLTDIQREYYDNQEGEAAEFAGRHVAINAVMNDDLTDGQRAALIVQIADAKDAHDELIGSYDILGDAAMSRAEQEVEANKLVLQSYRDVSLAVVEAGIAEALAEGGIEGVNAASGIIKMQEALGTITPDEAAKLEEIAAKTLKIQEFTSTMTASFLSDGELTRDEAAQIAAGVDTIANSTLTLADDYSATMGNMRTETGQTIQVVDELSGHLALMYERFGGGGSGGGFLEESFGFRGGDTSITNNNTFNVSSEAAMALALASIEQQESVGFNNFMGQ